jgi:hypothetical protein
MRKRKAPFVFLSGPTGLYKDFLKTHERLLLLTLKYSPFNTRTLLLNFKTVSCLKDQRVAAIDLASWFLSTYPVD